MLEAHLASCEACRAFKASMGRVADALGVLDTCAAPRDFGASVSFQLGRERNRRRWAPVAAAAAVVAGFLLVRPLMTDGNLRIASHEFPRENANMAAIQDGPAVTGGSMLDAMPSRPDMSRQAPKLAAAPAEEAMPAGQARLARPQPVENGRLMVAAAPAGAPEGALRDQAAPAQPAPVAGAEAEAKKEAASDRSVAMLAARPEEQLLQEKDMMASKAAAGPGGAGSGLAAAPAAPPAAISAYRTGNAPRARAAAERRRAPSQQAVDMATFEILRWMDPAADGGANFEVQEVDFTLP